MNKVHFFLVFIFLLTSCNQKPAGKRISTGEINHIAIIIDDQLWNGEIGDNVRSKFAAPVIGLAQEEPIFSINQYPAKLLEGYMTHSRNIIVIKKGNKNSFKIRKDEYAIPQNTVYITGTSVAAILNILNENSAEVVKLFQDTEIKLSQQLNDTLLLNRNRLRDRFKISMDVPVGYKYVLDENNFLWLKKDNISGNQSILIYQVPQTCLKRNSNPIDNIIKMRDSIGDLYIHGTVENSKMITEQGFAPYLTMITLDGKKTYHTKGTWELKNDFMAGPFINYAIEDTASKRLLIVEGFCYAPSKNKRDLVHELRAIIETIKFL
ncbi:MAG: DUF4837 family protein [Flavobacterium sp.]